MLNIKDLIALLAKKEADVKFDKKKETGTPIFSSEGKKEDLSQVGNFVRMKENSVIFRPAGGPMNMEAYFTFQGKGPQDTEIKLDDIDFKTLKFTVFEKEPDSESWIEYGPLPEYSKLKKKKFSFNPFKR